MPYSYTLHSIKQSSLCCKISKAEHGRIYSEVISQGGWLEPSKELEQHSSLRLSLKEYQQHLFRFFFIDMYHF